jgi:hypothetical protein
LQELHATVENIKTKDDDVIHAIQKQITYLKSVDEAVSQNAVGLATMARILKNVITNAFAYQKTWDNNVQHLEDLIYFQSNVSRTIRELEFTVVQLQQSVINLQEGLETSATGRLSSVLIPPHKLSKILQEVILKFNAIKITAVNSQATEIENEEDRTQIFMQIILGKPAIYNKRLKEHSDRNITTRMWSEICEAMIPPWHGLTSQEKPIKGEIICVYVYM